MEKKNTEISARVTEMIEFLQETPNSFAKSLGYKRAQTLYDIISGKSAPSYDFFNKVANAEISAHINIKWLITGKGNICNNTDNKEANIAPPHTDIIEKLLCTIQEQAEEIGVLKQMIVQLKQESVGHVSDASSSTIADAI